MSANIDKLIDYYAQANFVYGFADEDIIKPGAILRDSATNPELCGIVVPLSGSANVYYDNTHYLVKPGMILHATPRTKLDRDIIGNETFRCVRLYFTLSEKEVVNLPFFNEHFSVSTGSSLRISDIAQRLLPKNISIWNSTAYLRSKSLFQNFIEEIALSTQRQYKHDKGDLIEDAVAFIHENYSQQFSITEFAALYGMDRRRFGELFQRHTGRTPIQYLTQLRIDRAKDLLKVCGNTVAQVSEHVGYTDPYYFSRIFKQITGFSPAGFQAAAAKIHP
jgi:AraC-like DNA-binding protein